MANTVELTDEGLSRPLDGPDPLIGRTLRHYEVKERIGQGGMSVVYRGRDHRLHRDVAIKVLHPFLAEKPECRHRLAREAKAVARLEHDNILRIFDFSGDPPTLNERPSGDRTERDREGFLVTELVPGDTLKRYSDAHQIWDVPELGALITWQLACALAHAHENGVIHRDLKPENVMVRKDGVLKLMDFGIAQVVDSKSLTVTGTLLGSPAHMAPECIESFPADERSDVFSLGTVLYWLVTGALPFEALTPHALLKAIVDGRYAPPQQKNPRVSDAITRVIVRALATDRTARYASAQDMADDLRALLADAGVTVTSTALEVALADPEHALPRMDTEVRRASLAHAERLLDDDLPARALGVLSRVLASHPRDAEALALIERAQLGADDSPTLDDDVEAPLDAPIETSSRGAAPIEGTARDASELLPAARARTAGQRLALVGGVAAILTLVVFVARSVDERSGDVPPSDVVRPATDDGEMSLVTPDGERAPDARGPASTKSPSPSLSPPVGGAVSKTDERPAPASGGAPSSSSKQGVTPSPVRVAAKIEGVDIERALKRPSSDAKADVPATPAVVEKRPVELRVYPPATVEIDGVERLDVFRDATLSLAPGEHTLRFTNPAAVPAERVVVVPREGPPPSLVVQLDPAPAQVVVDTGGVDATIAIRPRRAGASDKILPGPHDGTRALPVFLEKDENGRIIGALEYEITATAAGKRPRTEVVKLSAGRTLKLSLVLEDALDAHRGDLTPAPSSP